MKLQQGWQFVTTAPVCTCTATQDITAHCSIAQATKKTAHTLRCNAMCIRTTTLCTAQYTSFSCTRAHSHAILFNVLATHITMRTAYAQPPCMYNVQLYTTIGSAHLCSARSRGCWKQALESSTADCDAPLPPLGESLVIVLGPK
jgi:hypothetical protein